MLSKKNSLSRSDVNASRPTIQGSNSAALGNEDLSPNGTIYYSADVEQETKQTRVTSKRQSRDEEAHEDLTCQLRRKQSKLGDDETLVVAEPSTPPGQRSPIAKIRTITPPQELADGFKPVEPKWDNPLCFAFLQSLNPRFDNSYLTKTTTSKNRSGYCIGRGPDNNIRIDMKEVSREHCLIYMETGSNGRAKGIRIYLLDKSFNGTFVNGEKVGRGKRILLKNGDIIQLYRRESLAENDPRHTFYRILFPPSFDANSCGDVYNFNAELGKGNFATVYRAEHFASGEEVAIKVMNKARFDSRPKFLRSIVQEMSIMMGLEKHPFVVEMKEIYNEETQIFLVLEYVKDGELFNYIRDRKKLTEDETRFIFWQLFNAVKFLHDSNVAHRDLKPENVIMADKKKLHIKVSDFGLAKTEDRDQAFDSQCGTPNYVAPEVLGPQGNRAYDKQCDLWSLGVMMYICLCGYPPFSEDNGPPSMKAQILMAKYEFLSPYWDGISDEAKDLIKQLLTVDPGERITVHESLNHQWMQMNPADMNRRMLAIGEDALTAVTYLGNRESLAATQLAMTQSQQSFPFE